LKKFQLKIQFYRLLETIFGKDRVRKIYLKHCVDLYRKRKMVFIHIPKAGGTSVAHALFGKRAGHFYANEIADFMGDVDYKDIFSFTIVRNPFDRLVSAYHFARQGGSKEGAIKFNETYQSELFQSFHAFVTQWLVFQDPLSIEIVFRPQYLFITDDGQQQMVNYIGKLEEIKESLRIVKQATGIGFPDEWKNRSSHVDFKTYYNAELEELVYRYYKRDFELLGYQKNI
jgi:hypothetical protein